MPQRAAPSPVHGGRDHDVARAWISVALIPVFFFAAFVVGEGIVSLLGYGGDDPSESVPLVLALLIDLPIILVAMIPAGLAVLFGIRARPVSRVTAVVSVACGLATIVFWVASTALALVDRLLGG